LVNIEVDNIDAWCNSEEKKLLGFQVSSHWHINSNIIAASISFIVWFYLQLLKEVDIHVSFYHCWYLPCMLLSIIVF